MADAVARDSLKVVIGVATRGDRDLTTLLMSLARQVRAPEEVVVASTLDIALPTHLPVPARHVPVTLIVTNEYGYVHNRNAVLNDVYRGLCSHLAWIDDDEIADSNWLQELLRLSTRYDVEVVLGPVVRRWAPCAPAWVRAADLPRRPRLPAGPTSDAGRTGNCLHPLRDIGADPLLFAEEFNLTGGEDAHFIDQLRRRGWGVGWAPEAIVFEDGRPEMYRWQWYVGRAFRNGAVSRECGERRRVFRRLAKALLLGGAALVRRRLDLLLRAAWEISFVLGAIVGSKPKTKVA